MKIFEIIEVPHVDDPSFQRLLKRGHFVSDVQPYEDWSRKGSYRVAMAPRGGTRYVSRKSWEPGQRERYSYYDPSLADLRVHDPGEQYIERTRAHPKSGILTEIPSLGEGFIYRGGSQEEYEFFQRVGKIESIGNYNIGDQQVGLTYWSTEPRQAASYANSFAPNGYKATFEHPAYVWVARMPALGDIRRVPGTSREEIGVIRPIVADEVVQIWRGRVYDYDEGDLSINQHNRVSSASMPSGRVAWELIFNSNNIVDNI